MDIVNIRTFLTLADSGSFSRTAELLFVTQPAVSKRISLMEESLGVPLFDRIGKNVQLTEAGALLIPGCQRIVDELEESKRIISNLQIKTSGTLNIATSHHIGLYRLPPVLKKYVKEFPDVELNIQFMSSEQACHKILTGKIELAVITLPNEKNDRLTVKPVWKDLLQCVVSKDHKMAATNNILKKELFKTACLLPASDTYTRKLIDSALNMPANKKIFLETNYLETIKAMVQIGLGWSMLPTTMIDKSLSIIKIKDVKVERVLGIVTHRSKTNSGSANKMIDIIKQHSEVPQYPYE